MTRENPVCAPVTGYILAGGASSRYGSDKALAKLGGETVLSRMFHLLEGVANFVHVVATAERYPEFRSAMIEDRWPGEGALGGIITALSASAGTGGGCEWNLIVSCDMPFLTGEWLRYMLEQAFTSETDVLFPRSRTGDEPLCACWKRSALPVLQRAFDAEVRKVTDAMKRMRVEVLDEAHWKRFDSGGRLFWNMNTQQDYEEAVRMWRTENE